MNNTFDRVLGASASSVGNRIDTEGTRGIPHRDQRRANKHPKPQGPFHLNEYLANRAYGGPEEGGWWYDTGTFVACHGTYPTPDAAATARDAKGSWLANRRKGLHEPSSVLCAGWPVLYVEAHPGANFPHTPPHYQ